MMSVLKLIVQLVGILLKFYMSCNYIIAISLVGVLFP